jgi:hypothetical protein
MKRCRIEPAYSQTPAERTGLWLQSNCMRLAGAAIAVFAFCFLVNWCVGGLGNFLASGDIGATNKTYHTDAFLPMCVKVGGSLVIGYLAFFRLGSNRRM